MKYFALAVVLLAVFASVVLADKPGLKKPENPLAESSEEKEEKFLPKKPVKSELKQKPESGEQFSEEELEPKKAPKKPLRPADNKKPGANAKADPKDASIDEHSEESQEKNPLVSALKPKPLGLELDIQPPHKDDLPQDESVELEPPSVLSDNKKLPKPAMAKPKH